MTTRRRHLSMRADWEDAIRNGRKTIDARLAADDIADLHVGSVIRYPGARVRVTHMRFYPGFADLLAHEDWHRIDPDGGGPDVLRQALETGHAVTIHDSGAVAIEFEPIAES